MITAYNGLLLLAALFFEALAVPLPGWGVYSAAYVPLLALGAAASEGVPCALAGVGLVWLGRGWRWGFAQAWPETAALLLASLFWFWRAPASLLMYFLCESLFTGYAAGRRLGSRRRVWLGLQRQVREIRALGLLAALGVVLIRPDWRVLSFLLLPLLAGYRAVSYAIFRLQSREANQALDEIDRLQATLDSAQRGEHSARQQLSATHEQRKLLEDLTRTLGSESRLDRAALRLFGLLRRSGHYQSVAMLYKDGEAWQTLDCQSPQQSRLENHRLLNFYEPLWEQAWRSGMALVLRQDSADRVFSGETAALAIPMGVYLLYMGRVSPPLSESECQWALWVAESASPLLQAIQQRQSQQQQLLQTQAQSQHLQGQVTALSGLLEASRLLASSLDRQSLGPLVERACNAVFPGTSGSLWLRPEGPERSWGELRPNAGRIAQVVQNQRPWMENGVLIHPLGSFPGALLVHWPEGALGEDDRALQEQLGLLAYNVGLAISNAEHQAQVLQSSKMAAVGQLAAGVAHELNSPLGAIALTLGSLSASLSDEKAKRKLERAAKSAQRCRSIIERLFIYTRLGSAQAEPVPLASLVEDTLQALRTKKLVEGVQFESLVPAGCQVSGRVHDLQELLSNLLLNAKESYPADVSVKKVQIAGQVEQQWCLLSVRDWGIGIEPGNLQKVLDPFFTTKEIGTYVGLGLSISREIARQHGGELVVQSAPGQGCLVSVRLPRA